MQAVLDRALEYGLQYVDRGQVATYIPELGKVHPKQLGVSVVTLSGDEWHAGDHDQHFTIQSISKTVALMLAVMDRGYDYVFDKVGMEPTGDAFNSIIRLETIRPSRPLNPMINAGAIAVDSLILGQSIEERFRRLLAFFRQLCHNDHLWYDEAVFASESATGYRNRALAHFMKDAGVLEGEVEDVLALYFRQCSIKVTCREIAMLGAVLAHDGISPITGEQLVPKELASLVKTFMTTCGMYDASGQFAVRVGFPAKSGVGGGIMGAVPHMMGIGVFGPALDEKGNSAGGVKLLEYLSRELELSIF